MLEVKSARHVRDYRVWIEFSNGERGEVDLEPDLWGSVFEPLRDPERFRAFTVSPVLHTLAWDNGADFAPEHLLEKLPSHLPQEAGRT